ncbi:hypothetical protein A0J61_05262, partial [Choanephora cucurbitarum]
MPRHCPRAGSHHILCLRFANLAIVGRTYHNCRMAHSDFGCGLIFSRLKNSFCHYPTSFMLVWWSEVIILHSAGVLAPIAMRLDLLK